MPFCIDCKGTLEEAYRGGGVQVGHNRTARDPAGDALDTAWAVAIDQVIEAGPYKLNGYIPPNGPLNLDEHLKQQIKEGTGISGAIRGRLQDKHAKHPSSEMDEIKNAFSTIVKKMKVAVESPWSPVSSAAPQPLYAPLASCSSPAYNAEGRYYIVRHTSGTEYFVIYKNTNFNPPRQPTQDTHTETLYGWTTNSGGTWQEIWTRDKSGTKKLKWSHNKEPPTKLPDMTNVKQIQKEHIQEVIQWRHIDPLEGLQTTPPPTTLPQLP